MKEGRHSKFVQRLIFPVAATLFCLWSLSRAEEFEMRKFRAHEVFNFSAPVIFSSDFAKRGFNKIKISEDSRHALPSPTPGRVDLVPGPQGALVQKVLRFTVPRAPNSYRSEIAFPHEDGWKERWYGERLLVPADWHIDTNKAADIVMQWHAIPGDWRPTHPNLGIAIRGRLWWIKLTYGDPKTKPVRKMIKLETPLEPGKWVDWVVQVKWSPQDDGLVRIWKDGERVFQHEGPTAYGTINRSYTPYLKTGIYRPEWKLDSERKTDGYSSEQNPAEWKVIYVSKILIGSKEASYTSVFPGTK